MVKISFLGGMVVTYVCHLGLSHSLRMSYFCRLQGCKRGASGKLFAMKVMNKRRIKIRQSEDLCWNERRILEALGSPFVVSHA